jgi:putative ABC transport system permease protein
MRAWLAALRIARREARRTRGRSLLVIALIGLPILGMTMGAALYKSFELSPDETADRKMGTGDAVVAWPSTGRVKQEPTELYSYATPDAVHKASTTNEEIVAALPKGTRAIADVEGRFSFRTATGKGALTTREIDYNDPLARGVLTPLKGRAATGRDEVSISMEGAKRIGAGLGGTLQAADGSRSWRIVGLVEDPSEIHAQVVVFQPGALAGPDGQSLAGGSSRWIVDTPTPLTWAQIRQLNVVGIVAVSREVLRNPPPASENELATDSDAGEDFAWATVLGGLLILEVVLLAGPAFAVGARRRRRELALVAAAGGTPAHLRRIVLADGVILGTAAAVAGILIGLVAAYAGRPLVEEHLAGTRAGAFRPFPEALVVVAALAVLAGVLAALVPAWLAARQSVVAALSGRYGATKLRRRWLVAGTALLVVGMTATVYGARESSAAAILLGLVLGELGLVCCIPALVGLVSRLGGRLPLAPRIALRDIGRNRAAAAPAISAVLAAVAVSAMVATVVAAEAAGDVATDAPGIVPDGYAVAAVEGTDQAQPDGLAAAEAVLRSALPVTAVTRFSTVACAPGTGARCDVWAVLPPERRCPFDEVYAAGNLTEAQQREALRDPRCTHDGPGRQSNGYAPFEMVIEPDLLPSFAKLDADTLAKASAVLRAGGALIYSANYVSDGTVTLTVASHRDEKGVTTSEERQVTVPGFALPDGIDSPSVIMSPATVAKLALTSRLAGIVAATSRMSTEAEIDKLNAMVPSLGDQWHASVHQRGQHKAKIELIILAIVAGVITLGAASIATGLAAADGKADLATLAAVGASPGVRRILSLSQTGLIAGLGSAVGVAAGFGAAAAMIAGRNAANADRWPAGEYMPIVVPWLNVAIALVLVPAVAMLGAGLLTRSRLPIERRA